MLTCFYTMCAMISMEEGLININCYVMLFQLTSSISFSSGRKLTTRFTIYVLLAAWAFSFIWTAAPLIGWSRYVLEPFGTSCSLDWTSRDLGNKTYIYGSLIFLYCFPLGVMVVCYFKVIRFSQRVDPRSTARDGPRRNILIAIRKLERNIDSHVTKVRANHISVPSLQ